MFRIYQPNRLVSSAGNNLSPRYTSAALSRGSVGFRAHAFAKKFSRRLHASFKYGGLLAAIVCQILFCSTAIGDDNENLRRYLKRHQLDRLAIRMREVEFSREVDTTRRKRLAEVLAQSYQKQLLTNFDSLEMNRKVVSKANLLISEFGELGDLPFRLAISHANYVAAETEFVDWWKAAAIAEARPELLANFIALESELEKQKAENERQRTSLIAAIAISESERTSRQQELNRIEARLVHANYLLGWVNYFLAVVPVDSEIVRLEAAHAAFYRALQLERSETIDQVDSKWLELSSAHSRRVLVGLGMVYTAQSQAAPSEFCFGKLAELDPYMPLTLRQFHSLAYCRNWPAAIKFSQAALAGKIDVSDQPTFWAGVVNAGMVAGKNAGEVETEQQARSLQRIGLLGLLRSFDGAAIRRLIMRHNIKLDDNVPEDLWISGLFDYQEAGRQSAVRTAMLASAEEKLNKAAELAKANFDELDRRRIRFLLGLIEFEQGEREQLLINLPDDPTLIAKDRLLAEKIAWLRCRTLMADAQRDHRQVANGLTALNRFKATFPGSSMAARVDFEKARLTGYLLPPAEALAKMVAVLPNDVNYLDARLEEVKLRYRVWEDLRKSPNKLDRAREAFGQLLEADQRFRSIDGVKHDSQLTSVLQAIKASVEFEQSSSENSYRLLDQANQLVNEHPGELADARKQLQYYQFIADQNAGQIESATKIANWLIEESQDKFFEVTALVFLVGQAEQQLADPKTLIPLYQQLSQRLGSDHESLAASNNARAAASRLVELNLQTGQLNSAKQFNDALLKTAPNQQQLLMNAARIALRQADYSAALPIWRQLATASAAGSDVWMESKISMIRCLQELDLPQARLVYKQTTSLAGELNEFWKQQFTALAEQLQLEPATNE